VSIWLLATIALVTYASRAAALAFLPRPAGRFEAVLSRMPAPIFASLATLTLVTQEQTLAGGSLLTAAAGALLVSPKRSFLLCLVGGIAGYAIGELIL
jgi:branched-subunit amino acid transport protein